MSGEWIYSSARYCKLTGGWGTASSNNQFLQHRWQCWNGRCMNMQNQCLLSESCGNTSCWAVVSRKLFHSLQMDLTIPIVQFFFKTTKLVLNALVCVYRFERKPIPKDSELFLTSLSEASPQSCSLVLLQYCWVLVLLVVQTNGLAGICSCFWLQCALSAESYWKAFPNNGTAVKGRHQIVLNLAELENN